MREFLSAHRQNFLFIGITVALVVAAALITHATRFSNTKGNPTSNTLVTEDLAGEQLSNGKCTGADKPKLTVSPMKPEDFAFIVPYGLVVGGHVTPIDHQYFTMKDPASPVDAYEVRAMADSKITDIEVHPPENGSAGRIRLIFSVSCRLFYYYDLVTSLSGNVKAAYEANHTSGGGVEIPVKAGEVIGRIGHQTLDFAVWDMDTKLSFLVPEHYSAEAWKIHTADPLLYYSDDLKQFIRSRYVRTTEPVSGKIDYDQDGKLIGNWFVQGTNGYAGASGHEQEGYWSTHLSIAPDNYDPTDFVISLGDFGGEAKQFAAKGGLPKPENVSVDSGLVKYDLVGYDFVKSDGSFWDQLAWTSGPKMKRQDSQVLGCFLAQLTAVRTLRAESFPGKTCSSVSGFDSSAKVYER